MPGYPARWFDGEHPQGWRAKVRLSGDDLALQVPEHRPVERIYRASRLRPQQAFDAAPLGIALPDGSTLELPGDSPLIPALQGRLERRPAEWLMSRWPTVLACLAALVALVVWLEREGIGRAAQASLAWLPRSVDTAVGDAVMPALERRSWAPSQLPPERREALGRRFSAAAEALAPGVSVVLQFRRLKDSAGVNAMALPNGHIVLLDGLAEGLDDEAVMAVLGHEHGHVVLRHGMSGLLRATGLLSLGGLVFGDLSALAGQGAAVLSVLRYGRDAEREADAHALQFMAAAGVPPEALGRVWRWLLQYQAQRGGAPVPDWASTHPATEERLQRAEAAAAAASAASTRRP